MNRPRFFLISIASTVFTAAIIGLVFTGVRELEPREVEGLGDAELTAVAKGFVARGGEAVTGFDSSAIAGVPQQRTDAPPPAVKISKPAESPAVRKAKRQLRCVQRAKGDVKKLARCS